MADFQTNGAGQFGSAWQSESGANLLVSVLLRPSFLLAGDQFMISRVTALAVLLLLRDQGLQAAVKWPNDILLGDRKVCGILIQNALAGSRIRHSVVGIGINVNQVDFPADLPAAGSMAQAAGRTFDREELLMHLFHHLENLWLRLRAGEERQVAEEYHQALYRLGSPAGYLEPGGEPFAAVLEGVTREGLLQLRPVGQEAPRTFDLKSISFL